VFPAPARRVRVLQVRVRHTAVAPLLASLIACVPSGSAPPWDAGTRGAPAKVVQQAPDVLTSVFEDNFDDRANVVDTPEPVVTALPAPLPLESAGPTSTTLLPFKARDAARPDALAALLDAARIETTDAASDGPSALRPEAGGPVSRLGPNWYQSKTSAWNIENGRLCGRGARNHGVWLRKPIPINARIEFDAIASSTDGDLKGEFWGDGQSSATSVSYTNATSYLAILGGWKNSFHVLARMNEHGADRKEIKVDKDSDDSRQHPVSVGQAYRFKVERSDGKTVRFSVNGIEYLSYSDAEPLVGIGHDHFGFNNWEVKVCFDNVKVTPL
jgi:hypothetical protein